MKSGVKLTRDVQIKELDDALKDPSKGSLIEEIIRSFSTPERGRLMGTLGLLQIKLESVCGKGGANAIINSLNLDTPNLENVLRDETATRAVKFLTILNLKYGAIFEGSNSPLNHDWYRISWHTYKSRDSVVGSFNILKRNGEVVEIETADSTLILLFNHMLKAIKEEYSTLKLKPKGAFQTQLLELQKVIDGLTGKQARTRS